MTDAGVTIELIRAAINDGVQSELTEEVDFDELYSFVHSQRLDNICFDGIKYLDIQLGGELKDKLASACKRNVAMMITQEAEKDRLTKAFTDTGIQFLPLKGWQLRDMYPKPEYRYMSDLDILIHRDDRDRARSLMEKLGYKYHTLDLGYEESYYVLPFLHVELHYDLFGLNNIIWHDYFANIWEKCTSDNGIQFNMNWNDYYIHQMTNYAKDYLSRGSGIRYILDLFFFLKEHEWDLDRKYVNGELDKLGVAEAEKTAADLAEAWFGYNNKEELSGETQKMADLLTSYGIYGSNSIYVNRRFRAETEDVKSKHLKKAIYVLRRAFPKKEEMEYKYPGLEGKTYLLPVYWIKRWLRHKDRIDIELKELGKIK